MSEMTLGKVARTKGRLNEPIELLDRYFKRLRWVRNPGVRYRPLVWDKPQSSAGVWLVGREDRWEKYHLVTGVDQIALRRRIIEDDIAAAENGKVVGIYKRSSKAADRELEELADCRPLALALAVGALVLLWYFMTI